MGLKNTTQLLNFATQYIKKYYAIIKILNFATQYFCFAYYENKK